MKVVGCVLKKLHGLRPHGVMGLRAPSCGEHLGARLLEATLEHLEAQFLKTWRFLFAESHGYFFAFLLGWLGLSFFCSFWVMIVRLMFILFASVLRWQHVVYEIVLDDFSESQSRRHPCFILSHSPQLRRTLNKMETARTMTNVPNLLQSNREISPVKPPKGWMVEDWAPGGGGKEDDGRCFFLPSCLAFLEDVEFFCSNVFRFWENYRIWFRWIVSWVTSRSCFFWE